MSTYPLSHPLEGWHAAITPGGHQVIHRHNENGQLHVGYAGHNTSEAEQRLGGGAGGDGEALPVDFHGGAEKDFDKLPSGIQDKALETIDRLSRQERHHTDHGWTQKLSGWRSARADYLYRITHRYEDEHGNTVAPGHASASRLFIGHIGPHNYEEAERRLAASTATAFFRQTVSVDHIDLYHRTTPEAAAAIHREKRMTSKENLGGRKPLYFSTFRGDESEAQGSEYGEAVVHVRVPEHLAEIDDEFPSGEQHYSIDQKDLRPEHIVAPEGGEPKQATFQTSLTAQASEVDGGADYYQNHRPADRDGIPMHDLTTNLPHDIYENLHQYNHTGDPHDQAFHEAAGAIRKARGNPDEKVRVYRSLPAEHAHQGFRPGDWVTPSKEYARAHGRAHTDDPKDHWPVIRTTVRAGDLHTDGDDLREWGYTGDQNRMGMVSFKGGYNQEVRHAADGTVTPVKRRAPKQAAESGDATFQQSLTTRARATTDDYTGCDQGHEHWGTKGAAGLLIRHDGHYLLQKRSPHVQHGGTWSIPGGALHEGETPEEGALREAGEEMGDLPDLQHHKTHTDDHGGWAYHTVIADAPHRFEPHGGDDYESDGHRWATADDIHRLGESGELHPGFAASWNQVRTARHRHAGGKVWYHGSPREIEPGTNLIAGLDSHKPDGDHTHVWISDDPHRAATYGDVYEVDPHAEPKLTHAGSGEYHVPGATVKRKIGSPLDAPVTSGPDPDKVDYDHQQRGANHLISATHNGQDVGAIGWEEGDSSPMVHRAHPDFPHVHQELADRARQHGFAPREASATSFFRQASEGESGPFFHGTAHEFKPGDVVDPSYELGGRRGKSYAFMTSDADIAHNYGKYKAQARNAIGENAVGRAHEVRPTGPVEVDDTVDDRFKAFRTRHPMEVVREVHPGKEATASAGTFQAMLHAEAAAQEFDDGVMVALVPPREVAEQIAQEGGQPVEDLHVTMAYLGNCSDYTKEQLAWLSELVGSWAARQKPIEGVRIGGAGKFENPGKGQHVLWAAVDIPGGAQMHSSLAAYLEGHGYKLPSEHGWMPHLTLAYVGEHFRFLPKLTEHSWDAGEVWTCVGKGRTRAVLGAGPR